MYISSIVLSSSSKARERILRAAGLGVIVDPSSLDEDAAKGSLAAEGWTISDSAKVLAAMKAVRVSQRHPNHLVVGADQILECEGVAINKPKSFSEAAEQLWALSGRTHRLVTAAVVVEAGKPVWQHVEDAKLTVRQLSKEFINSYIHAVGEDVLQCVGAYQIEGLGSQLFSRIQGDFFTIQGLPLLPLLGFLRERGVIPV